MDDNLKKRERSLRYKASKKGLKIISGSNNKYTFNGTRYVPGKGYAVFNKLDNNFIAGFVDAAILPISGQTELICSMTLGEIELFVDAYKEEK